MDIKAKLDEYPLCDVAVLEHRFARYMRDYVLFVEQNVWTGKPKGRYRIVFTHCVVANVRTTVSDEIWKQSWEDVFADYERWKAEGEPEGFVWGVCWSNAYPGLEYASDSALALAWSERLGKVMHEIVVETEAFHIQLVFHDVRVEHVDDRSNLVDKTITPLPPG